MVLLRVGVKADDPATLSTESDYVQPSRTHARLRRTTGEPGACCNARLDPASARARELELRVCNVIVRVGQLDLDS
jgi:hypothetical protein